MTAPRLVLATLLSTAAVMLAAWWFAMPLEKAALLAPIIVASVGAGAAILVLWTRVAVESLRRQRHPWRIVGLGASVLALLVVLSFFVELPGRGGH